MNKINNIAIEKLLTFFSLLLWLSLALKAVLDVDRNYDTWVYHLPFAARLLGMMPADALVFDGYFEPRYHGFGVLGEYLQGLFWLVTGRPESANLVGYLSLILFIVFLKKYFNVPYYLSTIALLAIPIVQIHATSSYIDLPSAIALATLMMMTYYLYITSVPITKMDMFIIFLSSLVSANMRLQFVPIVFLTLCFTAYRLIGTTVISPHQKTRSQKNVNTVVLLLAVIIIFYTPVKNLLIYGNPVYPVVVKFAGIELNHTEETPPEPELPGYGLSRPALWLYSVFEIVPSPLFDGNWTIDQGGSRGLGNQFGGYFGAYVLFNLILFIYLVVSGHSKATTRAVFLLLTITAVTAFMPSSPRLRYYMYWMIVLVAMNLALICQMARLGRLTDVISPKNMGIICLIVFSVVVFKTNAQYIRPLFYSFSHFSEQKIDKTLLAHIHSGDNVCIKLTQPQWIFLYSSVFQKNINYSITSWEHHELCKSRILLTANNDS